MKEDEKDYLEETFRKEVLKSIDNKLSKKEKEALMEEAKVSLDFLEKIDEVQLPTDNYVVFTDGQEQLLYENGEFYVISTTDSSKKKVKKTKKEATDMYLDFFIKYQLNPILDMRDKKKEKEAPQVQKTRTRKAPAKKAVEAKKPVEKKEPKTKPKVEIEKDEPSI